eukprot:TRINITY_DN502_c0_g1_i1.p1 TRINITY_DN502_c0_g1~~TRINITY_DN502_c0_g1_i1.p1  ORF type:complete len:894 (+),score=88.44 TRINITY_DN502_c0_g1_i1:51-2684(+)
MANATPAAGALQLECLICCDAVQGAAPIWSCAECSTVFHHACVERWSRLSSGGEWRCPACRRAHRCAPEATCYCGRRSNPTCHSCGGVCGKLRPSHTNCPHPCTAVCHAGPCPPCDEAGTTVRCFCGREERQLRCSGAPSRFSCGHPCGKRLTCGAHDCHRACHYGKCPSCTVTAQQTCYCGKVTESRQCCSGRFSCKQICERRLSCKVHNCARVCHDGECPPCALLPSDSMRCPCGAKFVSELIFEPRLKCTDAVPTCGNICGKMLPGCAHRCEALCHSGLCPPCSALVEIPCRCGCTTQVIGCATAAPMSAAGAVTCDTVCGTSLSCGRHHCTAECCGSDADHLCHAVCARRLNCGIHFCELLCHTGKCGLCLRASYEPLTCACGRAVIQPPVRCGTRPPQCRQPCSKPRPCGHPPDHQCHFGQCPPCTVRESVTCLGGHDVYHNVPCSAPPISCCRRCDLPLQCGHSCDRTCHAGPCLPDPDGTRGEPPAARSATPQKASYSAALRNLGGAAAFGIQAASEPVGATQRTVVHACWQPCSRQLVCGHACKALCHPGRDCPALPCTEKVTLTCRCGRRTVTVSCSKAPTTLECGEECDQFAKAQEEVQRCCLRLADSNYPLLLAELAKTQVDFLLKFESSLRQFITSSAHTTTIFDLTLPNYLLALQLLGYYGVHTFADITIATASAPVGAGTGWGLNATTSVLDTGAVMELCLQRTSSSRVPSMPLSAVVRTLAKTSPVGPSFLLLAASCVFAHVGGGDSAAATLERPSFRQQYCCAVLWLQRDGALLVFAHERTLPACLKELVFNGFTEALLPGQSPLLVDGYVGRKKKRKQKKRAKGDGSSADSVVAAVDKPAVPPAPFTLHKTNFFDVLGAE